MPQISIIVPVYKVEQYLHKCLDSILAQTFTDWECILIDDGSPDNSGVICDEYAQQDRRFRVIHQENKGSAGARNTGLGKAQGKYLICVDSDDWVEPDYLECLYNEAERTGADIVLCNLLHQYKQKTVVVKNVVSEKKSENLCNLLEGKIYGYLFCKFIRLSLLKEHGIKFNEGLNMWEDMLFSAKIFVVAKKFSYVNKALYHYRNTPGSLENTISEASIQQILGNVHQIKNILDAHGLSSALEKSIPILEVRARDYIIFCPKKELRKKFENEMKWTDGLLYDSRVARSFMAKLYIFCYLHNITWLQEILLFMKYNFFSKKDFG